MYVKRQISALLLIAMLASLNSCGGSMPADTTAAESTNGQSTEAPFALPEANFNGGNFTILNGNIDTWMTVYTVTAEEENGDTVNDAIYRRNGKVEDRYNIRIVEVLSDAVQNDVTAAIASGDDSFDIALMVGKAANAITLAGGAVSYSKIPYVDLEQDWWIPSALDAFSIANHVYYAISKFDTTHYDGARTLFFNKRMIEDYNLDSPYALVREGKWTLDAFYEMGMAVAQDLTGDNVWGAGDQFGYTTYEAIAGQTLMSGVGAIPSLLKDSNDMLTLKLDSEENITKLMKLASIFNESNGFLNPGQNGGTSGGIADFKDGRVLFYNECLGNIGSLRDMTDDFGILPGPKFDEAQENYYCLDDNLYLMLVPVTSPDLEKTGLMMEALAYESVGLIDVAFYDTFLSTKVTRDEDSAEMLDIIFDNLVYHHAVARSYTFSKIAKMIWAGDSEFASYFASNAETIAGLIDNAVASYEASTQK